MIHEFRQYTIRVGKLPEYLSAFESIALPLINRHMHMLGFWTSDTGDLSKVFHLWAFEDHEQRTLRFARLRAEPVWINEFLPVAFPLVEKMHSTVLLPTPFNPAPPLLADPPVWSQPASMPRG